MRGAAGAFGSFFFLDSLLLATEVVEPSLLFTLAAPPLPLPLPVVAPAAVPPLLPRPLLAVVFVGDVIIVEVLACVSCGCCAVDV